MTQIIQHTDDTRFMADIAGDNKPRLIFFHQPHDEACEFNGLVIEACARARGDSLSILELDKNSNPQTTTKFSLPDGPIFMMIRNDTILGYLRGKVTQANLDRWIDNSLAKPDADGVAVDEFLQTIEKKQARQSETEQSAVRAARRNHMILAGIRVAGGLLLTTSFAVPGFGLAGFVIAGYSAFRAFSVYADPEQRRPQPPQSLPGKILEAGVNAVTWAGAFGLLAVAFNVMAGAAFYATAGTALVMLGHSSVGLGRLLPAGLLIGSLRRDADEMSRRDPTKPLDEYSPPAPQPEFEVGPQLQNTAATDFKAAVAATPPQQTTPPASTQKQAPQPRPKP
jgi:hypothetical protein